MIKYLTSFILGVISITSFAQQNTEVKGKIVDSKNQISLPGATVILTNLQDTLYQKGTVTNQTGDFNLNVKRGNYSIKISFIGYKDIEKQIKLEKIEYNLGVYKLIENNEVLKEVKIVKNLPPTKQKGDTTVFNPDAYKVNPDASAEELLSKMPGFYSNDGKLMAQGKEVKEVLVDGKKFFGNNVDQALETIPNDVIKNIELYDYKSDKEKLSGFKDKEKNKTINIVTNKKKNKMIFGRITGGIGNGKKFAVNGTINQFTDNNRITVSAKSKNVNAPLRLKVKNTISRVLNGNKIQRDNIGFNFNTKSKKGDALSANYNFSNTNSENKSNSLRTYTSNPLIGQKMATDNFSKNDRINHNLNLYYQMFSNPKQQIYLNTSAGFYDSNMNRHSTSETQKDNLFLNSSDNINRNDSKNYRVNQGVNIMRNLNDKGRSLSLYGDLSFSKSEQDGKQLSETKNKDKKVSQSINQIFDGTKKNMSIAFEVSLSEKINETSNLSLGYGYTIQKEKNNKKSYNYNSESKTYSNLDKLTSNQFENTTTDHTGRLSYDIEKEKHRISFGTDLQFTNLKNKEKFPSTFTVDKNYFAILPSASYTYNINDNKHLSVYYRMGANNPSARNLQELLNISNPLYVSMGNSNLKQAFVNDIMFFYNASNMEKASFTSIYISAAKINNTVAQKTIVAKNDTLINGEYLLPSGGQFSQPINLNGEYNLSLRATYSMPVNKIKSKLNTTSSINYTHTPTLVNNKKSFTNSFNLNQEFSLNSNLSEKLDFTLASKTEYFKTKNSESSYSASEFVSQTSSLGFYWNFYKNFNLRTNASNIFKKSYDTKKVENNWLINIGIASKVFKNKRGEISLVAYDILNSKSSRKHSVRELYTVDSYTNKLDRFFMLSFSYKIRNGKSSKRNATLN
jgi:hypothetical protein